MPSDDKESVLDRYFVFIYESNRKWYRVIVKQAQPYDVERWMLLTSYGHLQFDGSPGYGTERRKYYDSQYSAIHDANLKGDEYVSGKGYREVKPGEVVLAFGEENKAVIVDTSVVTTEENVKKKRALLRE